MARATTVTMSFRDGKTRTSNTRVFIPSTTALVDAIAFAHDCAENLVQIAAGLLTKVTVSIPIAYAGANETATSDVQKKALFVFADANGLTTKILLPAFDEAKCIPDEDNINLLDADVAAFRTLVVTGDGTIAPCTRHNTDIVDVSVARKLFRRRDIP